MSTFWLYLKQKGGGCDYTIGCAQKLEKLKSTDVASALAEVKELLSTSYTDDREIDKATMFEVSEVTNVNIASVYAEIQNERNRKAEAEKEQKDFFLYETLRKKFEK